MFVDRVDMIYMSSDQKAFYLVPCILVVILVLLAVQMYLERKMKDIDDKIKNSR
jgi:hypothetical protein